MSADREVKLTIRGAIDEGALEKPEYDEAVAKYEADHETQSGTDERPDANDSGSDSDSDSESDPDTGSDSDDPNDSGDDSDGASPSDPNAADSDASSTVSWDSDSWDTDEPSENSPTDFGGYEEWHEFKDPSVIVPHIKTALDWLEQITATIEHKSEEQLRPLMEKYYFIPKDESFSDAKARIVEKLELINSVEEITVWVEMQRLENLKQSQDASVYARSLNRENVLNNGIDLSKEDALIYIPRESQMIVGDKIDSDTAVVTIVHELSHYLASTTDEAGYVSRTALNELDQDDVLYWHDRIKKELTKSNPDTQKLDTWIDMLYSCADNLAGFVHDYVKRFH